MLAVAVVVMVFDDVVITCRWCMVNLGSCVCVNVIVYGVGCLCGFIIVVRRCIVDLLTCRWCMVSLGSCWTGKVRVEPT